MPFLSLPFSISLLLFLLDVLVFALNPRLPSRKIKIFEQSPRKTRKYTRPAKPVPERNFPANANTRSRLPFDPLIGVEIEESRRANLTIFSTTKEKPSRSSYRSTSPLGSFDFILLGQWTTSKRTNSLRGQFEAASSSIRLAFLSYSSLSYRRIAREISFRERSKSYASRAISFTNRRRRNDQSNPPFWLIKLNKYKKKKKSKRTLVDTAVWFVQSRAIRRATFVFMLPTSCFFVFLFLTFFTRMYNMCIRIYIWIYIYIYTHTYIDTYIYILIMLRWRSSIKFAPTRLR